MSTVVATIRAYPYKYEKNFDAVVTFLTQHINKRAPTLSVKITFVGQTRPAKKQKISASNCTFQGKIE